jgi:outer membrane protein OmpA-like peptidoglycan-associated protein
MSKRDNPAVLVLTLIATFGVSVAGIWWAHQFGLGLNSGVENDSEFETVYTSTPEPVSKLPNKNTLPPTPITKQLKTANDIGKYQVKGLVKFPNYSTQIPDEGVQMLNKLAEKIAEFDPQTVAIRVISNFGDSESYQSLGQERGEEVAGYLRDRGLKHKIVISRKRAKPTPDNFSPPDEPNPPVEIQLYGIQ